MAAPHTGRAAIFLCATVRKKCAQNIAPDMMLFAVMSPSINSLGAFLMLKKFLLLLTFLYAAVSFAAVDANQASAAELDSIKGIGPAISTKILDEHKKGHFNDWHDFISRVNGLGEKNAAKFSAQGMTINGSAYSGAPAPAPAPKAEGAAKK